MPITLQQDSGIYFRDKNACRTPDHPMEAAVLAVLEADASPNSTPLDLENVDLVACSSTLGNLLRFCSKDAKPFRMIVYTVGKTVHFIRRENSPRETIPDVLGYGHTFPEAFTSWDACVLGSESHQRIVSYQLGGLKCLVRFEADGYLPAKNRVVIPRKSKTHHAASTSVDEITSIFTDGATFANKKSYTAAPIIASSAGVQVDQESLFDLKTRSVKRRYEEAEILASELPRLWIRQMSNFILAFHNRGTFEDVQVKDVGHEVDRWQKQHQREIECFSALLATIIDCAKNAGESLEICVTDDDPHLQVRQPSGDFPDLCSAAVRHKWATFLGNCKDKDESFEKESAEEASGTKARDSSSGANPIPGSVAPLTRESVCDEECNYSGRCV